MSTRGLLLHADDNADDRLLLSNALHAHFPEVTLHSVADGEAALAYLRNAVERGQHSLPHVALLDWNMPRKTGLATLSELKADPVLRRLPVVIVAAAYRPHDPDNALRLGASGFFRKPRSQHELAEVLTELSTYWLDASDAWALVG
jgi:CheY-like chemotaxis protein